MESLGERMLWVDLGGWAIGEVELGVVNRQGGAGAARGNPTASVVVDCLLPVLPTCPICSGLHWSGNLGDR